MWVRTRPKLTQVCEAITVSIERRIVDEWGETVRRFMVIRDPVVVAGTVTVVVRRLVRVIRKYIAHVRHPIHVRVQGWVLNISLNHSIYISKLHEMD